MAYEHNEEPNKDVATRTGEFAMLAYSIGELTRRAKQRDVIFS